MRTGQVKAQPGRWGSEGSAKVGGKERGQR